MSDSDAGRHDSGNADELGLSRARTRVSRACTRCRSRKDKCDGGRPSCAACLSSNQHCSYEPSTKKRGLPEGYVRGLEKLWAVLIAKIDGLEDTVAQILEDHRDTLLQAWNHRQSGEELHSMWKDSRVLQELENLLAALDSTSTRGIKRKRDRDDDDAALQESSPDVQDVLSVAYNIQTSPAINGGTLAKPLRSQTSRLQSHPDKVILPPAISEILGQYFKFTHCWLPMLDKPRVLRSCYQFSRADTMIDHSNADLAVIAAALAYASQYGGSAQNLQLGGLSLAELSRKCIPPAEGTFELGHVQALLILALHDIGTGHWEAGWRSVGLAVRAVQAMQDTPSLIKKDHTATRQVCLILETVFAIRLGRTPQLSSDDIISCGLLPEDGHEEWEPWTGFDLVTSYTGEPSFTVSCFNRLTKIFAVLNDCVRGQAGQNHLMPQKIIREKLQDLAALSDEYPVSLDNSTHRPPHQMWLKATHLLSSAYITAMGAGQTSSVMQSLETVSDIIQAWTTSSSIGPGAMPTFILGLLNATCEILFGNTSASGMSLSNPHAIGLLSDRLNKASRQWPEAGLVANKLREHLGRSTGSVNVTLNEPAKRRRGPTLPLDPTQTQHGTLNLWPPDPFTQTFASMPHSIGQPSAGHDGRQSFADLQIPLETSGVPQSGLNAGISFEPSSTTGLHNMSLDGATTDNNLGHHPSIATSPSFQGDEIDALFREMAQLDTTEWARGRSQALKDFGFDDMTFEAFCNDPDRLYSSENLHNQQLNSMNDGSALTFDPSLVNQPLSTGLNTFDMTGSSWTG